MTLLSLMSLWSQGGTAPIEVLDDDVSIDDRVCHLLDDEGRALCFADVSGRAIHSRAVCRRQRHRICPTCSEIDARRSR